MIPLRDTLKSRTFPIVNLTIIIINVLIFIGQTTLNELALTELYYRFGLVPSWFLQNIQMGNFSTALPPLFTSIFLHGGWVHIISNMLFLWVFGDNIEDRMGHLRYLGFYLIVGAMGNIAQIMASSQSTIPIIGASGAVAGILGAYYVSFPRAKVLAIIPLIFFFTFLEVRATFFIIGWFFLQVFNGIFSLASTGNSVAWWAHIGGFLGGLILIPFLKKTRKLIHLE